MNTKNKALILVAIVVDLPVCFQLMFDKKTSFPPVGKVTRIEVTNNMSTPLKKIVDKKQISEISAFVDKNASGWGGSNDWAGVPVPKVVINLYDGEKFKGHFGLGTNFFETQRNGDFMSKSASDSESEKFLSLLGMGKGLVGD